jgi:aspartate dehydrogenase
MGVRSEHPMEERVAVLGFGAIGRVVAAGLAEGPGPRLAALLVRSRQVEEARAALPDHVAVVDTLAALLELRPTLVVESAGQGAVREHGAEILSAGIDLMVVSTGALAGGGTARSPQGLRRAGRRPHPRAAGAIAGLDGLAR